MGENSDSGIWIGKYNERFSLDRCRGRRNEELRDQTKQNCEEKPIGWIKKSYMAKNLDIKVMFTKKDLVFILLYIILNKDSKLVKTLSHFYPSTSNRSKGSSGTKMMFKFSKINKR